MDKNQKLYVIYRIFGYEYMFYTVINFLYFTITKGISVGQVMYLSGFYAAFCFMLQIPINFVIEKIGLKKSMNIGNLCWIIHILIIIFTNNFYLFVIGEMFSALGTTFKTLSEQQYLYASLKQTKTRSKFGKIEGKSVAGYYMFEAISALFVGFLFEINQYIPIYLTLLFMCLSFALSLMFENIKLDYSKKKNNFTKYLNDFKLVLKSKRIKAIYVYVLCVTSIVTLTLTLQKSFVSNLEISPVIYGFILSIFTLCIGLGSRLQYKFEKKAKRKTLTYVGVAITGLIVLAGILSQILVPVNKYFALIFIIIIFIIHNTSQGIYRISVKKYLNNFTNSDIRGKVLSMFYIFEGVGKSVIMFVAGYVIDNIGTNYTAILIGVISTCILLFILKYMKKHVGLNEDEYSKEDLWSDLKN